MTFHEFMYRGDEIKPSAEEIESMLIILREDLRIRDIEDNIIAKAEEKKERRKEARALRKFNKENGN